MSLYGKDRAIEDVRARIRAITERRALYFAARDTMVKVTERVFDRGQMTSGAKLKYDEDYDLYAYRPPAPRKVSGIGKPYSSWKNQEYAAAVKKRLGGNARKIKGGYYETYLAFKADQGRTDAPFELTGRLRKAYLSSPDVPSSLISRSEAVVDIILTGDEAKKYAGLTDKKGRFLQLSQDEISFYQLRLRQLTAAP